MSRIFTLISVAVVLIAAIALAVAPDRWRGRAIAAILPPERAADGALVVADNEALARAIANAKGETHIRLAPGRYEKLALVRLSPGVRLKVEGQADPAAVTVGALDIVADGPVEVRNLTVARETRNQPRQHLAFVRKSSGVRLENLRFRSPLDDDDRGREYGLMIRDSADVAVRDSQFTGLRYGIGVLGVKDVTIERNELFDLQTDAIRGGGVDGLMVRANIIGRFSPKPKEHPDGIQLWSTNQKEPGRRIVIRDNLVTRDTGGIVQGIFIRDTASKLPFEQVEIAGNLIIGGMFNGIAVSGAEGLVMMDNRVIAFNDQKSWISITNTPNERAGGNQAMMFLKDRERVTPGKANRHNRPVSAIDAALVRAWLTERGLEDMAQRPYLADYLRRIG
ncbi:right-handed parallel beta-helix repeat-containing protein [Sphingomonas sp.]